MFSPRELALINEITEPNSIPYHSSFDAGLLDSSHSVQLFNYIMDINPEDLWQGDGCFEWPKIDLSDDEMDTLLINEYPPMCLTSYSLQPESIKLNDFNEDIPPSLPSPVQCFVIMWPVFDNFHQSNILTSSGIYQLLLL